MKKNIFKILLIILLILLLLWSLMCFTDYTRCKSLKNPVFAVPVLTNAEKEEGVWKGLGYAVTIYTHTSEKYEKEMHFSLFGSGVIIVTLGNNDKLEIQDLDWLAAFIH